MTSKAVPWRRAIVALVAVVLALGGTFLAFRSDGVSAVDATVPRATRWFVHQASGRVVLADGFSGRALARLEAIAGLGDAEVAQGAAGAAVIDRNDATAREVDQAALRLGSPQSMSIVRQIDSVVGIGRPGLVAVDAEGGEAVLLPNDGSPVPFEVPSGSSTQTRVSPDGAVWIVSDGRLTRTTSTTERESVAASDESLLSLVGNAPLVFDPMTARVSFDEGSPLQLPQGVEPSEVVLQAPGPGASCGWVGADDRLWCVGATGIEHTATVAGLDIDGGDLLGIAGDAAAVVRRGDFEIVRFDWRSGRIDGQQATVAPGTQLEIASGPDLVWVDATNGDRVWAINPWGIRSIRKDDDTAPLIGETGEVVEAAAGDRAGAGFGDDGGPVDVDDLLDDNGVEDPPVANPDPVTARSGVQVLIDVTANDYDPDGDAIAVVGVTAPRGGRVEISSASTVTYQPELGFVGFDEFEYTIADGSGLEATAVVTLELLNADAPNREPVGKPDLVETGAGAEVVADVLLNDVDPERDALRIASFTQPPIGTVTEVRGVAGLPALRYEAPPDAGGATTFSYRPVDSLGAIGASVTVEVEIASRTDENRPPVVRPDAVLVRRDIRAVAPVLINDRDPDGDRLTVGVVRPLPDGIDAVVNGETIEIVARAGTDRLTSFGYTVDDGQGNVVVGDLLVVLLQETEPNRAPLATPDSATAVAGTSILIDVLSNDSDPDGDPVSLVSVTRDEPGGAISVRGDQVAYTAVPSASGDEEQLDHFEYVITDGRGERTVGEVTVRILDEPVAEAPFAQDDVASTTTNSAVTIDVLRNDGDPSGERPSLVGDPGCAGGGTADVVGERVRFTPPLDETGRFTCTYEVTNSQGLSDGATITVTVVEPEISNQPPVTIEDRRTIRVEEEVSIDVLANDSDPDGDEIELLSFGEPTLGSVERSGDRLVYTAGPTSDVVTIGYEIQDSNGARASGSVVITIIDRPPEPPVAADDLRTIIGPGVPTAIAVLDNDDDADGDNADLTVVDATIESGDGSVEVSPRSLTLTPDPEFVGDLTATYTIADATGLTAQARAVLTVLEPLNRPPEANDDNAEVISGGTVTVRLGENDRDLDGDALTYRIASPPDADLGLASLDGSRLVFSAKTGASGIARTVYEISDGEDTDTATVTIRIVPCVAAEPIARDRFYQTGYRQPITIDLTELVENGEIIDDGPLLSAPVDTYTPPEGENGNVTFTYVVRNSCGAQAIGRVTIDVNQDPTGGTINRTIGRDDVVTIPIGQMASDDEPLVISELVGAPGWVSVVDGGQGLRIDPGGRSEGTQFEVVISDPGGLRVTVPVSIVLINRRPVANDDTAVSNGQPVVVRPLANDTDADGDAISLAAVPGTFVLTDGTTATISRSGSELTLDPNGGSGRGAFTYTVVDSTGLVSEPATVTLEVNNPPIAPSRVDAEIDAGSTSDVLVNASDPDGDPITLSVISTASPLTATVSGLNVRVTVPEGTLGGTYDIRFRVADPSGLTAEGTIVVSVRAPEPTTTTTTTPPTTAPPPTTTPITAAPPTTEPPGG